MQTGSEQLGYPLSLLLPGAVNDDGVTTLHSWTLQEVDKSLRWRKKKVLVHTTGVSAKAYD